jgi:hypothetical protein
MSEPEEDPNAAMARGYARGRERDEAIRAALVPLPPGQRTTALTVAVVVALVLAAAIVVGALTSHDLRDHGGSLPAGLFIAVVLVACAWGMWHTRYWAVLAFDAFMWFHVIVASLALVVASSWAAFVICIAVIGLAGWMAWKLIRVMARIQAHERAQLAATPTE